MGNDLASPRTLCIPPLPVFLVLVGISILQIPCLILISCHGFFGSLRVQLPTMFKILYWFTSLVMLMAGITYPLQQIAESTLFESCDNLRRMSIMACIPFTCYMLSLICISLLYLLRYTITFREESHAIKFKFIVAFFIFGIVCQCVLCVILTYLNSEVWYLWSHGHAYVELHHTTLKFYLSFTVINTTFNIFLLILFMWKVYSIGKNVNFKFNKQNDEDIATLISLIDPVVIWSLCLFTAVFSSILTACMGYARQYTTHGDTNILYVTHMTLFSVDVFINYLSVNLQFNHFRKLFNALCGCCHQRCMQCLIRHVFVARGDESSTMQITVYQKLKVFNEERILTATPTTAKSTVFADKKDTVVSTDAHGTRSHVITLYDPSHQTITETSETKRLNAT
eukprot:69443_1